MFDSEFLSLDLHNVQTAPRHSNRKGKTRIEMKSVFVAICLLVTQASMCSARSPTQQCPTDWSTHKLLPHETDCDKFYSCSNGTPFPLACPAGLHFSDEAQICDWPESAGCISKNNNEETPAPVEPTISPIEPTAQPVEPTLSPIEPTAQPVETTHAPVEPTTSTTAVVTTANDRCKQCTLSAQYWPDEKDCRKFWKCVNGSAVQQKCADGLLFNEKTETCDLESNVVCTSSVYNFCEDCTAASRYHTHPDCDKFWKCVRGKKEVGQCSGGLLFNVGLGSCDLPQNVQCSGESELTTTQEPEIETTVIDTTLAPTEIPTTQEPEIETTVIDTTLAPTEIPTTQEPEIETTVIDTTLAPTEIPTTQEPEIETTVIDTTLAPTEIPTTQEPEIETTLAPTEVPKHQEPVIEINDADITTKAPAIVPPTAPANPCDGATTNFVPNSSDCTRYYFCSGGRAIELRCDTGREFDPVSATCLQISDNGCTAQQRIPARMNTNDFFASRFNLQR